MHIGFSFSVPGIKGFRVFIGTRTNGLVIFVYFWLYLCYLAFMLCVYMIYGFFWVLWQGCRLVWRLGKHAVRWIAAVVVPFIAAKINAHRAEKAVAPTETAAFPGDAGGSDR